MTEMCDLRVSVLHAGASRLCVSHVVCSGVLVFFGVGDDGVGVPPHQDIQGFT
jgi:glucose-6-phosphate-specific signal transduction histidine kinase